MISHAPQVSAAQWVTHDHPPIGPLVEADRLATLGPVRLLHVLTGQDGPSGINALRSTHGSSMPDTAGRVWTISTKWTEQINCLGLGHDATKIVIDDIQMTGAARDLFILQYFGLPALF